MHRPCESIMGICYKLRTQQRQQQLHRQGAPVLPTPAGAIWEVLPTSKGRHGLVGGPHPIRYCIGRPTCIACFDLLTKCGCVLGEGLLVTYKHPERAGRQGNSVKDQHGSSEQVSLWIRWRLP
jgi:hypothetical protein